MTDSLIKSCQIKSKLLKTYRKYHNIVSKTKYKNYSKVLKSTLRNAEKLYYSSNLCNCANNLRQTWKERNSIIKATNEPLYQREFSVNNCLVNNPVSIVNHFNKYFTTIGSNLASTIPSSTSTIYDFLGHPISPSIYLTPTDNNEIANIIKNLKHSSSTGPDGIPAPVIKAAAPFITTQLTDIINVSLKTGIFPTKLKYAKVSPIYKSGDHNSFSNYRPISVLNIFSKFFEKVINTRLVTFFNKHNIITDSQFGFRSGYSTYMPLVSLIDKITENLDRECPSIAIFIDFRKAFDTIDHRLLIKKIRTLRGKRYCFKSYNKLLK